MFTIPLGIQHACCTLVGTQIGEFNPEKAKTVYRIVLKLSAILFFIETVTLIAIRDQLIAFFSDDELIRKIAVNVFPVVLLAALMDYW